MPYQASVAELKARARNLRTYIEATSGKTSHSKCLEHIAHIEGFKDWNACVATRPRFRPGMTDESGIDIDVTTVPKCDFAYKSIEYIRSRIGASDLKLVYSATEDPWWKDFILMFWMNNENPDDGVSQGDEGFEIRTFSARDEAGTLWVELKRDGKRLIALCYPEDRGLNSSRFEWQPPNDPAREEKSKSSIAKDRAWANRPVKDEFRVFADSDDTFQAVKNSHIALLTTRLKFWNFESSQSDRLRDRDGQYIFETAIPGSIWKCHAVWDQYEFTFWNPGETIEIIASNKKDNTVQFRHIPSGRVDEMTAKELIVGFWSVDQFGDDVAKTHWKIYRKNGSSLSGEKNEMSAYDY